MGIYRIFALLLACTSLSSCVATTSVQTDTALAEARKRFAVHAVEPLCHAATWVDGNMVRFWSTSDLNAKFATGTYASILAQANGYDCDIGRATKEKIICLNAVFPHSNFRTFAWRITASALLSNEHVALNKHYVNLAKAKKLECGAGATFEIITENS